MRKFILCLSISGVVFATAARAATWQVGPSIGVDLTTRYGSYAGVIGAPLGADLITGGLRPGLRVGAWDSHLRHELFLDTSFQMLSGSSVLWTTSNTLNYAYAFDSGPAWYATAGGGFAIASGNETDTRSTLLYGLGFGRRHRLNHGHGSVRVEARYDGSETRHAGHLTTLSLRLGWDLDLN